jgi:two-component system chemotaxis response regulator CheB
MRAAGARTLGQDEASCVVYGMPKAAFETGAVERQVSITRMGGAILDLCATEVRSVGNA